MNTSFEGISMRIIFFAGKGGVGKTSIAAATGIRAAEMGKRTVVLSYDVPLPGDDYFNAIEDLFQRLRGVDKILTDPETTSVRLVTNPEKIVLKETQRAFMYFSLYKMSIDSIVMNRILPEGLKDSYFQVWKESQSRHIEKAREVFRPIPVWNFSRA